MLICALLVLQKHILYIKWIMKIILKIYSNQYLIVEIIVKLLFLFKKDADLLAQCGYSKSDIVVFV